MGSFFTNVCCLTFNSDGRGNILWVKELTGGQKQRDVNSVDRHIEGNVGGKALLK